MFVNSAREVIRICREEKISISEYTIQMEMEQSEKSREEVMEKMGKILKVMKESSQRGIDTEVISVGGLIGGDAPKLIKGLNAGQALCGDFLLKAMARALSCSEVNAAMGKIVAAPTAGSCGILPAVIITTAEALKLSEENAIKGLFAASGVGILIAKNATLAGAEGGCQAECGSAAAMAAAAAVEMRGGTVEESFHAGAIALKNIMGLVCDPIAGLVECPCAERNVSGAVNALICSDMVLCGMRSLIPFDEVVKAMYKVGRQLPPELRETAMGGIAATPTGIALGKEIMGK